MKSKLSRFYKVWKIVSDIIILVKILLIPVFSLLLYRGHTFRAIRILLISGISTLADSGMLTIADYKGTTRRSIEKLTDKLNILSIAVIFFIKFAQSDNRNIRMLAVVFLSFAIKDFMIIIISLIMIIIKMKPCKSKSYGKISMGIFYILITIIMVIGPETGVLNINFTLPENLMLFVVAALVTLSVISGISYLPDMFIQLRERKKALEKETMQK